MTAIPEKDLEKFENCNCGRTITSELKDKDGNLITSRTPAKARYFCKQSCPMFDLQPVFCSECNEEGNHDHGTQSIHKVVTQIEGPKWQ